MVIIHVNQLADLALNDDFSASEAGKIGEIHRAVADLRFGQLQDGGLLGVQTETLHEVAPLGDVVVAAFAPALEAVDGFEGGAVEADAEDAVFFDDHAAHAGLHAVGPLLAQEGDVHVILVQLHAEFAANYAENELLLFQA